MSNSPSTPINHSRFLRKIEIYLFIVLLIMVGCFFTWSENIGITRMIKVLGRMGVLVGSIYIYQLILSYGAVASFKTKNNLAIAFYIGYLVLGFASFMWTTNVGYSALQWFMTVQSLVFCYYFMKSLQLLHTFFPNHNIRLYGLLGNVAFVLIGIFVVGSFIDLDVFFRLTSGGEEARLGGYIINPNELGMLAGVGIACLIFNLYHKNNKWWTISKLLIIVYALILTGSRSSLIGVLIIALYHISLSSNFRLKFALFAIFLIATPIAVNKVVFKDDGKKLEEVMSLTGRIPFWTALIHEGLPREPYFGFGFMRIDYKEYFQSTHTYPGKMTHNTFIQVLMNLGFVGLSIVLFQFFLAIGGILKEEKESKLMLIGILIPILINSFTEFGIFGESNYGILFYQLILMAIFFKQAPLFSKAEKAFLAQRRPDLVIA